ncbi:MAG: enoyl-CoA hydratase/isomerase family protein [Salinirussus sp.]
MPEEFDTTIAEFDDSTGVGHLTLNRPDALNALSDQLRTDIVAGLRWLADHNDDSIECRAVVMEGAEGNFCAGADINEFEEGPRRPSAARDHYRFIMDFPLPVIAKIRGYALGGGLETAMACDIRYGSEDARVGLPEVDLGILPGAGGVQFISRLADPSIAKEVAMTGRHIPGEEAADMGILTRAYPDDELDTAVADLAAEIASKPPLSVQAIKQSGNLASQTGLREGIEWDRKAIEPLLGTEDHEKGARAFAEDDYEPEFKGR